MKGRSSKDYYQVLGIHPESSEEDIKNAYRELARLFHPDAVSSKSNSSILPDPDIFKSITEAYAVLSNPTRRQEYDVWLAQNKPDSSMHWLKGQKTNQPDMNELKPNRNPEASKAWKARQNSQGKDANSRARLFIISILGVAVGLFAALGVFLIIKVLFLR